MENNLLPINQTNTVAIKETYSISEITAKYKKLNTDLVEALEIFTIIFSSQHADSTDIKALKKLNLVFENLVINEIELKIYGQTIYTNIMETVFEDALDNAKVLFGYCDPCFWESKYETIVNIIIMNDVDVSNMLLLFKLLYESLKTINRLSLYYYLEENHCTNINFDIIVENYNFNITVEDANKYADLKERINFYHSEIATKELICVREDKNKLLNDQCREFIDKCYKAIEITENQLKKTIPEPIKNQLLEVVETEIKSTDLPESTELSTSQNNTNPAFTTSRQVLAIYYLLNEIDRKGINQVDKTEKAKFIEFLTGKNYNNIYKALSNPFKGLDKKNPKRILNDMEYVTTYFEKLGLQSIVQKINADAQQDE